MEDKSQCGCLHHRARPTWSRKGSDTNDSHQHHAARSCRLSAHSKHHLRTIPGKERADRDGSGLATGNKDHAHRQSFVPSQRGSCLGRWLPICILALRLLIFDSWMLPVGGKQPILGASLSWAIDSGFRRGVHQQDRTVTFTLHSAVRMSTLCNYTLEHSVNCSTSHLTQTCAPDNVCGLESDAETLGRQAVKAEHGVLCIGQVVRTPNGVLELLYTPSDANSGQGKDACASDASGAVAARLPNGTYFTVATAPSSPAQSNGAAGGAAQRGATRVARSSLGKANAFTVTSLHHDADPLSLERRVQGMNVALGVLTHTVHVEKEAVGLIAWLSTDDGASIGVSHRDILLPECGRGDSTSIEPCSTNVNSSAAFEKDADDAKSSGASVGSSSAHSEYWAGGSGVAEGPERVRAGRRVRRPRRERI